MIFSFENADGETWTRKAEATCSLDMRVYQFRHIRKLTQFNTK